MLVSLEWLKELVPTDAADEAVTDTLTMVGLEVEGVERRGADTVFEVNVTPNRPDCLSLMGIARELSAATGDPVKFPNNKFTDDAPTKFVVEIQEPELCRRYAGRVITGVKVAPSPRWMAERLEKCGIRSINNVVDITNYVLLELGHPLHAFDLATLRGGAIVVARAGKDKKITTLDGLERSLPEDAIAIWDRERPVALAGVMGGAETEVGDSTTDVFLESAWFNPISIRRTSRELGMSTESSYRFERGADIVMLKEALDRAAYLIREHAGGKVQACVDIYPLKYVPVEVKFSHEKINRVLGTDIPKDEINGILKRLGLGLKDEEGPEVTAVPPPYRGDIRRDADIFEEVARLHGFGNVPTTAPRSDISMGGLKREHSLLNAIKASMRASGLNETISYSFMNEDYFGILELPDDDPRRAAVRLMNPLRQEEALLRTMLVPSIIDNLLRNVSRFEREVRLFETSRVFLDTGGELPTEGLRLGGVFYKEKHPELWDEQAGGGGGAGGFYVLKGAIESLLDELGITGCEFRPSGEPFLHRGKSADLVLSDCTVGFLGVLSPAVAGKLEPTPRADVTVFELDLDILIKAAREEIRFERLPRFPFVERDLALIVGKATEAATITGLLRAFESDIIENVSVFDSYEGKNIPKGKKSLAFNIRYRSPERTLKDEEVDALHEAIVKMLVEKTGGELRGA